MIYTLSHTPYNAAVLALCSFVHFDCERVSGPMSQAMPEAGASRRRKGYSVRILRLSRVGTFTPMLPSSGVAPVSIRPSGNEHDGWSTSPRQSIAADFHCRGTPAQSAIGIVVSYVDTCICVVYLRCWSPYRSPFGN